MQVQTTRFGQIEVPQERIIKFTHGLPGFPEEKAFAILPYQPDSPFSFLQSVSNPDLSFLIVNPFHFFSDYTFQIDDQTTQEMALSETTLPQIFNIVTIPDKLESMTANLLAPLLINPQTRIARQIVLEKTSYTTRHRLFPQGINKSKSDKGGK